MGRGIGTLQQAILNHLEQAGHWRYAWHLTQSIWPELHPEAGEDELPSAAFYVSVRRALNALKRRDLVRLGESQRRRYGEPTYERLACWLPSQRPPDETLVPLTGAEVERVILAWMDGVTDEQCQDHASYATAFRGRQWQAGQVPYSWLLSEITRKLAVSQHECRRIGVAVNRAVRRLADRGELHLYYDGRSSNGRLVCGWLVRTKPKCVGEDTPKIPAE